MNIGNSLWYKTIDLRGLLIVWSFFGFAPQLTFSLPLKFDDYLVLLLIFFMVLISIRGTIEAIQTKSLIKLTLYGLVPLIIMGISYAFK